MSDEKKTAETPVETPVEPVEVETYSPSYMGGEEMTKGEMAVVTVVFGAVASFIGAVVWAAWKSDAEHKKQIEEEMAERKRKREERELWFESMRNEGRIVVETVDGEYLAISAEEFTKTPVRRKGR